MKKKGLIITLVVAVAIAALAGIIALMNYFNSIPNPADSIHAATAETGNLGEKIVGDPDTAAVVLYEYADYACSHCSEWNQLLDDMMEQHPGKMAIVFRGVDIGFANGAAAGAAATAAQMQGYWKEYKDLLFANQIDWFYLEGDELDNMFVEYFRTASNCEGDEDKFKIDMASEAVSLRMAFEERMGRNVGLKGTPMFRIDGQTISASELLDTLNERIGADE